MKKFINKNTGLVEIVTNETLIEQYEKNNEVYELVKEKSKTANKPKTADKPADENKDADTPAE